MLVTLHIGGHRVVYGKVCSTWRHVCVCDGCRWLSEDEGDRSTYCTLYPVGAKDVPLPHKYQITVRGSACSAVRSGPLQEG